MKFLGISKKESTDGKINIINDVEEKLRNTPKLLNLKKTCNIKKYTHIRLSELATFCPREYAIGFKYGKEKKSFTDYPLMQQFEIGSALHFWYQNFSKVFKDVLYGYWKCWACGNIRGKDKPLFTTRDYIRKTNCEHCGASGKASFYEEYMFRVNTPYRVVGKLDGFIMKDNKLHVMDIKTFFTKEDFPKLQDVSQIVGYMLFYEFLPEQIKVSIDIDTSIGYLYYVSKKFSYTESILEYPIYKDHDIVKAIIKNVKLFTDSINSGELPHPFDICIKSNWSKGKAKKCYLKDLCKELYARV